jgi:hypothetical protein
MPRALLRELWPVIRPAAPRYWGKLTADDLDAVGGQYESFVRVLRARYGFSLVKAEDELDEYLYAFAWPGVSAPAA